MFRQVMHERPPAGTPFGYGVTRPQTGCSACACFSLRLPSTATMDVTVTKSELAACVSQKLSAPRASADASVNALFEVIGDALARGESLNHTLCGLSRCYRSACDSFHCCGGGNLILQGILLKPLCYCIDIRLDITHQ